MPDEVDEKLRRPAPGVGQRVANRGQRRHLGRGGGLVVEADDGDVLGHPAAGLFEGPDRPYRGHVVAGEDGSERVALGEDGSHRLVAALHAVQAGGDEVLALAEAQLVPQPHEIRETGAAVAAVERVSRDEGDAAVAVRPEVLEGLPEAVAAVGHHGGVAVPAPDEHDGEPLLLQRLRVPPSCRRPEGGDEQEAVGVPRPDRGEIFALPDLGPRRTHQPRVVDPGIDAAGQEHVAVERTARLGHSPKDRLQEPVRRRPFVDLPAREDADRGAPSW